MHVSSPYRKIAICGVPGTGKSALARELSKRLTKPLIHHGTKELRRTVGEMGELPPFWRMNEVQRMLYQLNLIKYRLELENNYAEFVADGCAVDMTVWYRMCSWLVPLDQKRATLMGLQQACANYDAIFYLPYFGRQEGEIDEEHVVDPENLLTADFIMKGTISYLMHSGYKSLFVIQTPPIIPSTSPDIPNDVAALNKRVDEVLEVVLGASAPVGTVQ